MFFRFICSALVFVVIHSCTYQRKLYKIRDSDVSLGLSMSRNESLSKVDDKPIEQTVIESGDDDSIIMNAVEDPETGEMVATDVICPTYVTARFMNVAERSGYVSVSFDVTVPRQLSVSRWKLRIDPQMKIKDSVAFLDPIFITGSEYRKGQMRGYERYQAFLASIITDSTVFVKRHLLETFLQRHFPETYAMKTDTSFVSEPDAANLFGVRQHEAVEHYKRHLLYRRNERRKGNVDRAYKHYVKDPIVLEGIRLDTVLASGETFIYRYTHTFKAVPKLRKVVITLKGSLYERGEMIHSLPDSDELTFYISSMSTLMDNIVKYRMKVLERTVHDNMIAFIDFDVGSSEIDTSRNDNASEIRRVRRCISDILSRTDLVLDSLVILASCSLEGSFTYNRLLSNARSKAVCNYLEEYAPKELEGVLKTSSLPENWDRFRRLVRTDTVLTEAEKSDVLRLADFKGSPDRAENRLAALPQYAYLKENLYPKLRTVTFNFFMHRAGMVKDTIHTTEIDSVYMRGLDALSNMDYKNAVTQLRPYKDYNAALALLSAGYDHSALEMLNSMKDDNPKVCYLKALALARLGKVRLALSSYEKAVAMDSSFVHRANLDPEMYEVRRILNVQLK